jgi:hypothetical protein
MTENIIIYSSVSRVCQLFNITLYIHMKPDVPKNKFVYCMGVTIISNVLVIPLFIERHVTRFQPINVSK